MKTQFYPELQSTIDRLLVQSRALSEERQAKLEPLVNYIAACVKEERAIVLNYICTHNSRRSHLGQIWSKLASRVYGFDNVVTYSGGTEATAFNERAVAALERAGFSIEKPGGENPHYLVSFAENEPALECFSKRFDDEHNRAERFAAVMTCNDADQNCPVIIGATRISLPYVDPKEADNTDFESERYTERSEQIGSEQLFVYERALELLKKS